MSQFIGQNGINTNKLIKSQLLQGGLVAAGNVAGILVAVKRKSGFWGGVGWFFLLGAAGGAVGLVINSMRNYNQ